MTVAPHGTGPSIVCFLGSKSDLSITVEGLQHLKSLEISFDLRIASAHRTPEFVTSLVRDYDQRGTQAFICVAGMSAHLAGVVASLTLKPVIAVPVSNAATAGLDALLSMVNMPPGIPTATMGFDSAGFRNGCILATQILALKHESLARQLSQHRKTMCESVEQSDHQSAVRFRP